MASKRIYYTKAHPDPQPAIIVDDPDIILRKNKKVESLGSSSHLIRANSLPKNLSSLEDIEFDLSFEHSLFRTKYENSIYDSVIDPNFIQFIEQNKETIQLELDQQVLETFDKLDSVTATLIKDIDEAYFQHYVELASLTAFTPKFSTIPSETEIHLYLVPHHLLFPLHFIPLNHSSP